MELMIELLMVICVAAIVGFIGWGIWYLVENVGVPDQQTTGRVVDKKFTPAWMQTIMIYNAATKTSMPSFIHHPDTWTATVKYLSTEGTGEISEDLYNEIAPGSYTVLVTYRTGRFSRNHYLHNIERI